MVEVEENKSNINIKNIKSPHIMKKIFSFLYERQKLKILLINKKLQKMFFIDIENYKSTSGKYKVIYEDGKGKEFLIQSNIIIFEGEYLNGKKSGKGKEFNDYGKLIFEGEYLKGKRNGKGKEYNYNNGIFQFEGEYLNGRKNGKGKKYYYNGFLKYEGEYLTGKKNGKGKKYYDNGFLKYEGEYLNGMEWKKI